MAARTLVPSTLEQFTEEVRASGVDLSPWGKGEAKTLAEFFEEFQRGECTIVIDPVLGFTRVLSIVRMLIHHPSKGWVVEKYHILPDGRRRERNKAPAGKMRFGEQPQDALVRELKEELALTNDEKRTSYTWGFEETRDEEKASKSYPGIRSVYRVNDFLVLIDFAAAIPEGFTTREVVGVDEHGKELVQVNVFGWTDTKPPVGK